MYRESERMQLVIEKKKDASNSFGKSIILIQFNLFSMQSVNKIYPH